MYNNYLGLISRLMFLTVPRVCPGAFMKCVRGILININRGKNVVINCF